MAHLYVDENLAGHVVDELRNQHDVVFAGDGGQGRTDAWHFRQALTQQRILVTLDRSDFQYLHRLWTALRTLEIAAKSHAGIPMGIQLKEFTHAKWLAALGEKLATPEELIGRMSSWHPTSGWHEDDSRPEE